MTCKPDGVLIVDATPSTPRGLRLAGFETNPLEDGSLDGYRVLQVPDHDVDPEAVDELRVGTQAGGAVPQFLRHGSRLLALWPQPGADAALH